jgi:hypothetical protein
MSNAIAQSATKLAVSPNGEANYDFRESVTRAAFRSAKGITRERQMLNRQKLISAVCVDYRLHFSAIHGRADRLPTEIHTKICNEVDSFLTAQMNHVNTANIISHRRSFFFAEKDMQITERETLVGENQLDLQQQLTGIILFIGAAQKKLKDLEAKPTPNYDLEKEVKARIMKLEATKSFINSAISNANKQAIEDTKPSVA